MGAWENLIANSSLDTGDAWEHLLAQEGGGGGTTVYVGAVHSADARMSLSSTVSSLETEADTGKSLSCNYVSDLILTADITNTMRASL